MHAKIALARSERIVVSFCSSVDAPIRTTKSKVETNTWIYSWRDGVGSHWPHCSNNPPSRRKQHKNTFWSNFPVVPITNQKVAFEPTQKHVKRSYPCRPTNTINGTFQAGSKNTLPRSFRPAWKRWKLYLFIPHWRHWTAIYIYIYIEMDLT